MFTLSRENKTNIPNYPGKSPFWRELYTINELKIIIAYRRNHRGIFVQENVKRKKNSEN